MTDIYEISSQLVDDFVALSPDTATRLGIPGSDHLWDDTSPAGMARVNDLGLRYREDNQVKTNFDVGIDLGRDCCFFDNGCNLSAGVSFNPSDHPN